MTTTRDKKVTFKFHILCPLNEEAIKTQLSMFLKLKSIPKTEISETPIAVGSDGSTIVLITLISVVANILTIADILYNHLRTKKKTRKTPKRRESIPIVYILIGEKQVVLNGMSRNEIIDLIKKRAKTK